MDLADLDDIELLDRLIEIDDASHVNVTSWEAKFLASMMGSEKLIREGKRPMTPRQRNVARKIIETYGDRV